MYTMTPYLQVFQFAHPSATHSSICINAKELYLSNINDGNV
jgi:hypothetical protein